MKGITILTFLSHPFLITYKKQSIYIQIKAGLLATCRQTVQPPLHLRRGVGDGGMAKPLNNILYIYLFGGKFYLLIHLFNSF